MGNKRSAGRKQGAQSQHYVPQFILRQFLWNEKKEQVAVFDKINGRQFTPSIADIMTERRYNEFMYMDVMFSFEETLTRCEAEVLPTYRKVLETRKMPDNGQEIGHLAMLLALQFSRTRNKRDMFVELEEGLAKFVARSGHSIQEINGWEPLDENNLKKRSIMFLRENFPRFCEIIFMKDMFLMEAPPNKSFYIGDDPVILHNDQTAKAWSTIGLSVQGIQISMPLSRDLLLCAWCPSVAESLLKKTEQSRPMFVRMQFGLFLKGAITSQALQDSIEAYDSKPLQLLKAIEGGIPLRLTDENLEFYNSKQVSNASRWVISPEYDFSLASDFIKKFPGKNPLVSFA